MNSLATLNQQFALDTVLTFQEHSSGLLVGQINSDLCLGQFFLQGAHVTDFRPTHTDQPVLFLSQAAIFEPHRAIRGGIPICFPWFSNHPADSSLAPHGWARNTEWQVTSTRYHEDNVEITLSLNQSGWQLEYQLSFGAKLRAIFSATNTTPQATEFEIALHSYFNIGAIEQVSITGDLAQVPFLDQLTGLEHPADSQPIVFSAETDRIYQGLASDIELHDQANQRIVRVVAENSASTIVWNPWIAKSKRMADFGDDEYLRMCCIETANVRQNRVCIAPQSTHRTSVEISVVDLARDPLRRLRR